MVSQGRAGAPTQIYGDRSGGPASRVDGRVWSTPATCFRQYGWGHPVLRGGDGLSPAAVRQLRVLVETRWGHKHQEFSVEMCTRYCVRDREYYKGANTLKSRVHLATRLRLQVFRDSSRSISYVTLKEVLWIRCAWSSPKSIWRALEALNQFSAWRTICVVVLWGSARVW